MRFGSPRSSGGKAGQSSHVPALCTALLAALSCAGAERTAGDPTWEFAAGNSVSSFPATGPDDAVYTGWMAGKLFASREIPGAWRTAPGLCSTTTCATRGESHRRAIWTQRRLAHARGAVRAGFAALLLCRCDGVDRALSPWGVNP